MLLAGCSVAVPTGRAVTPSGADAASPLLTVPADPTSPLPSRSPRPTDPTVALIEQLETRVTADATDAEAHRDLGFALVQRVRETADASLYARATEAFETALRLEPGDASATVGIAGIQLGKHEFEEALVTARAAIELSPSLAAARAAEFDALLELGRYDEAQTAAGEMLGLGVDLTTLARVSYLAELRGQLPAAVAAMRQASEEPGLAPENGAYVSSLLGNLLVYSGDPTGAADAYAGALQLDPNHAAALAGQARLAIGAGDLSTATSLLERAVEIVPFPEYIVALGDVQSASGQADQADRSYEFARAQVRLAEAAGAIVDVDLALLEADHGDPATALRHATAAYEAAPTVRAADALAWALHRSGDHEEAARYSKEALRLGSIDPLLHYHAGAIEAALGNPTAARDHLEQALATDPGFSAAGAAEARRLLATLS